jgi:GntR family transcriptional repressor for pyruvate dehydrogenase complex
MTGAALILFQSTVVRLACERMTAKHLRALHDNVEYASKLSGNGDRQGAATAHAEFHILLAGATGDPVLMFLMRSVTEPLRDLFWAVGSAADEIMLSSRYRLLGHMSTRDADHAARETEQYLKRLEDIRRPRVINGRHVSLRVALSRA